MLTQPVPESRDGVLTDLQNARRFAKENEGNLLYVAKSRLWFVWNGKRCRPDNTGEVNRRAKATVERLLPDASALTDTGQRAKRIQLAINAQSASRIAGMIELAQGEAGIPITQDQLNANSWLPPLNTIRFVPPMGVGERKKRIHPPDSIRSVPNPIQQRGRNE